MVFDLLVDIKIKDQPRAHPESQVALVEAVLRPLQHVSVRSDSRQILDNLHLDLVLLELLQGVEITVKIRYDMRYRTLATSMSFLHSVSKAETAVTKAFKLPWAVFTADTRSISFSFW